MTNPFMVPVAGQLMTPRIVACLLADNMETLFSTLALWSQDELKALARELDAWYQGTQTTLTDIHAKRGLDEVYSEIQAVVRFYLKGEDAV